VASLSHAFAFLFAALNYKDVRLQGRVNPSMGLRSRILAAETL